MAKKKRAKKSTTTRRRAARRPHTKRRTNSGTPPRRKVPWKELLIAGVAGVAALYAGGKIAETETFKDFTEGDSKTEALTQAGVGLAGGAAVYYLTKSTPAALGVVAGLAGVAGYAYLNDKSEDKPSAEVTVSGEGTAGLGYLRRRRLGQAYDAAGRPLPEVTSSSSSGACCAACAAGRPCAQPSGCKPSCPMPDDMAAIYDENPFDTC